MTAPFMSPQTRYILGLDFCLSHLKPASPYGQAHKQSLKPFLPGQEDLLEKELDAVESLLRLLQSPEGMVALGKIFHYLTQLPDWREPLDRAAAGGVLSEVELFGLKQTLYFLAEIAREIDALPPFHWLTFSWNSFAELSQLLDPENSGSPAFYISDHYSPTLAEIRSDIRTLQRQVLKEREEQASLATTSLGLRLNPSGEVVISRFNRDLRQRIDATGLFSLSRETYTDLYLELKPSLREAALEEELDRVRLAEEQEEERVRIMLSTHVRSTAPQLRQAFANLGYLDLVLGKSYLAQKWRCCRPRIFPCLGTHSLEFVEARHPRVEDDLQQQNRAFAPVSLKLKEGLAVVTGANMGGKTVTLRTIGLLAALASFGFYVPAESASLTLFRHIAILAGDYSTDLTGLSRFGQEVAGLNDILPLRSAGALLLLDELAASTNPTEGSALAIAVAEYLRDGNSVAVLTTHYDLLARLCRVTHWQVIGLSLASATELEEALAGVSTDNGSDLADLMDYRLQLVNKDLPIPREAIRVAMYLHLPQEIIARASQLTRAHKGGETSD